VVVVLAEAHHVASPFFLATWEVDILQLAQGLQHQIQSFLDHPGHRRRLHIWAEISNYWRGEDSCPEPALIFGDTWAEISNYWRGRDSCPELVLIFGESFLELAPICHQFELVLAAICHHFELHLPSLLNVLLC